jgi:hypothetical protein
MIITESTSRTGFLCCHVDYGVCFDGKDLYLEMYYVYFDVPSELNTDGFDRPKLGSRLRSTFNINLFTVLPIPCLKT